jgi:hypothetical protein
MLSFAVEVENAHSHRHGSHRQPLDATKSRRKTLSPSKL